MFYPWEQEMAQLGVWFAAFSVAREEPLQSFNDPPLFKWDVQHPDKETEKEDQ